MFDNIRKIAALLTRRERVQAAALMALIVLAAGFELLGMASILPFLAVLSDPAAIEGNRWLRAGYEIGGFADARSYMMALGAAMLAVLVIANTVRAGTRWLTLRYSHQWGHHISLRLFARYLRQPYAFFVQRHSADLSKNILSEVQTLIHHVILTLLDIAARLMVAAAITGFLVYLDARLAAVSFGVLAGVYALIYLVMRPRLTRHAAGRQAAQAARHKIVNEALRGIKQVKLSGHEEVYLADYARPSLAFAQSHARSGAMGDIPRHVLEVVAFGGIVTMTLYLLGRGEGDFSAIAPLLALYAYAGYRLLPGLQAVYGGVTRMRFYAPVVDAIAGELEGAGGEEAVSPKSPLPFHDRVAFHDVGFHYPNAAAAVLSGVNLALPAGRMIGIRGPTGAGKTTFADLFLGLLEPTAGYIAVDGVRLGSDTRRAWQDNLSYVSQAIYLMDDTVTRNIAFGVAADAADSARVREAARMAALDDFIENELPRAYDTVIGENGVRLSGGQRQRLGLARALYEGRPVLVLDEATSALDPATEARVMAALHGLKALKTILMISHRPDLLAQCDAIIRVEGGQAAMELCA